MGAVRCPNCRQALAKGASFCSACGAPRAAPPRQGSRLAVAASAIIVAVGAGAAAAIMLAAGDGSATTVVTRSVAAAVDPGAGALAQVAGSVQPGRYIQAGSFQTVSHAEAERQRLASDGIDVEVVSSNEARELYPGFQVLLGGPFGSRAAETAMLTSLHRHGVPSAFGRSLTPAPPAAGPASLSGRWTGRLERTSAEHPNLDGLLPADLTVSTTGRAGTLDFPTLGCHAGLSLMGTDGHALSYDVEPACAGTGPLLIRPSGDETMLTLRSPSTDAFALGTLACPPVAR